VHERASRLQLMRRSLGGSRTLNGEIRVLEPTMTTVTQALFRPVGQPELDLIAASSYRAFPPRLPGQPIFYPVLNEAYAVQIARDWNTKDAASGYVGYVTRFEVRAEVAARYATQTVGERRHQELWVPADELEMFNAAIVGFIEVIAEFRAQEPRSGRP
jgi:hypothetical protein